MQKIVLTFGLISGGIIAVLSLLLWMVMMGDDGQMKFENGEWLGYSAMIIALSMIYFGTRSFRDKHLGGQITFGKAFQVGILITLVASFLYVSAWMIFYNTSETAQQFPQQYLDHQIETMKASGMAQAAMDAKIAEMKQQMELYKNPLVMMGVTLLEIFPVGLIITLISSFLLKRKPSL